VVTYAPQDFAPEQEVRSELPPFAVAPHWVTFSVSGNATKLYNLYAAHGSGDSLNNRVVYPTLDDLAEMMHLSRGDKVTPYMRELEKAGAIVVEKRRTHDGLRWRYRITVKLMPPEDYEGPMSTGDWYARYRPEYAERHAKSSIPAGQPRHPENRGFGSGQAEKNAKSGISAGQPEQPENRAFEQHENRDRSKTNLNNNNFKDHEAPSARSAADAGGSTSGSRGRASVSGVAASGGARAPKKSSSPGKSKSGKRMSRVQSAAVRAVEETWPRELAALLPRYRPDVIRDAILDALDSRSVGQLAARIERRWVAHGYADALLSAEGKGISSPVGVAVALVRPTPGCRDLMCEDGTILDTGVGCRACSEREVERRGRGGVPRQVGKAPGGVWECEIPTCRTAGSGPPPDDGLCPSCHDELERAAFRLQAAPV
jgi:hypothetical protein